MNAYHRLAASVAFGGCLAAAALHAPDAHADASSFLADLHSHGWKASTGDDGLLRNGYQVCRMLNSQNGNEVADFLYRNTGVDVSYDDAGEFVLIAVRQLCPWHDHRSGATA